MGFRVLHGRSYPVESDGGMDGHDSKTGVVPSEETSVCGFWYTKNLDVNNKL